MLKKRSREALQKYYPLFIKLNIISLVLMALTVFAVFPHSPLASLDKGINSFVANHASPEITTIGLVLSDWGSATTFRFISIILGLAFLLHSKWRRALVLFISVIITYQIVDIAKAFFMRMRPENADHWVQSFSYPSGHAAVAAAFFFACMYAFVPEIKKRSVRIGFSVICTAAFVVIGLARVALNVHWLTDVIGGWALGVFVVTSIVLLTHWASDKFFSHKK